MAKRSARFTAAAGLAVGAVLASQLAAAAAASPPSASSTTSGTGGTAATIHLRGSSSVFPTPTTGSSGGAVNLTEDGTLMRFGAISHSPRPAVVSSGGQRRLASATAIYPPSVTPTAVLSTRPGLRTTWAGLDEADNDRVGPGSLEPPDQGLCVGNGKVLEIINDTAQVFSTSGGEVSPAVNIAGLFGYSSDSSPFITDPSCVFDPTTQRFYLTVLTLDLDSDGNLTGTNHLDISVSKTSNPVGGYWFYSIPVTDTGGANGPRHKDCPCIGDYPHIGTDAHGFYVTTNEYPFSDAPGVFGNNFNGAQLYAMSKTALAHGASDVRTVHFGHNVIRPSSGGTIAGFTMLPAQASGAGFATAAQGPLYIHSSTAAEE